MGRGIRRGLCSTHQICVSELVDDADNALFTQMLRTAKQYCSSRDSSLGLAIIAHNHRVRQLLHARHNCTYSS